MTAPEQNPSSATAYKKSGVDIEAGNTLVERIKTPVKESFTPGVMTELGGFGALFDLKKTGFKDPLLVAATDGVGTKLRLAIETGRHNTIGTDLVAMCVNDLLASGAAPLFFLDYYACGKLDIEQAQSVITGIAAGCREAGCALIGGETAEMPGMYQTDDYDLAGFAVGAVERTGVLDGPKTIEEGDVLIGVASSGPHSNGYSLIRKIITDSSLSYDAPAPFAPEMTLGEALLIPTKIYVRSVLKALQTQPGAIRALAHITGGGLTENIARILPQNMTAELDASRWPFPPVFSWLCQAGDLSESDLALTFNCGLGLVLACKKEDAEAITASLNDCGEQAYIIGNIIPRKEHGPAVRIENHDTVWLNQNI